MADRFHLADLFEVFAHMVRDRLAGCKVSRALIWVDEVRRAPAGKQECCTDGKLAARAT